MKPRIKIITLAVRDLEKSMAFYRDGMGLPTEGIVGTEFEDGAVAFFEMNDGLILALWPKTSLAKDAKIPVTPASPSEFSIGHNVHSKEEVDAVVRQAERAGAIVTDPPHDRFWGGMPDTSRIWTGTCGKSPGIPSGLSRSEVGWKFLSSISPGWFPERKRVMLSRRKSAGRAATSASFTSSVMG